MSTSASPANGVSVSQLIDKVPGFVWGYVLGVASGITANALWDKWKHRKQEPPLTLTVGEKDTTFSGRFDGSDATQLLKTLREAAKCPTSEHKREKYRPPEGGAKT